MFRSRFLHVLVLVLILLFLSPVHCCTGFFDLVLSEQHRFLTYQQRGLSRDFVKPFYLTFLKDLDRFYKRIYPDTPLVDVCFKKRQIFNFFENVYKKSAIDDEVKRLEVRFPHLPYLNPSKQQDIPIDYRFNTASATHFQKTVKYLNKGKVSKAAALPRTVHVFYDPGRANVLFTHFAHASHGPKKKASDLLSLVTGMVLSLEFMKVPRRYSVQMLRHTVAWLSTVFRALQDDGPDLWVPVLYLPFYRESYKRLRKRSGLDFKKARYTKKVVEKLLGDVLKVYTRLDAWGRLEIIRWEDRSIWTIEEKLFSPELLKKVAKKIGYDEFNEADHPPYDPDVEGMDGWDVEFNSGSKRLDADDEFVDLFDDPHLFTEVTQLRNESISGEMTKLGTGVRQADMCEAPLYEYMPLVVSTWEEACCASICCNSVLMMDAGTSTEACCGDCNQLECPITGSSLEVLAMVHLEPYGDDEGGAIPVSL